MRYDHPILYHPCPVVPSPCGVRSMAHGDWYHVRGVLMHPIDEAIAAMQERRWQREKTVIRFSDLEQMRHAGLLRLAQERQIFGRTTMARPQLLRAVYESEYGSLVQRKTPPERG